jgi:hypothetical protein
VTSDREPGRIGDENPLLRALFRLYPDAKDPCRMASGAETLEEARVRVLRFRRRPQPTNPGLGPQPVISPPPGPMPKHGYGR